MIETGDELVCGWDFDTMGPLLQCSSSDLISEGRQLLYTGYLAFIYVQWEEVETSIFLYVNGQDAHQLVRTHFWLSLHYLEHSCSYLCPLASSDFLCNWATCIIHSNFILNTSLDALLAVGC